MASLLTAIENIPMWLGLLDSVLDVKYHQVVSLFERKVCKHKIISRESCQCKFRQLRPVWCGDLP